MIDPDRGDHTVVASTGMCHRAAALGCVSHRMQSQFCEFDHSALGHYKQLSGTATVLCDSGLN